MFHDTDDAADALDDAPSLYEQARQFYDLAYKMTAGSAAPMVNDEHPLSDREIDDLAEQAEVIQPARRHDQIDPEYAFSPTVFEQLCRQAGDQDAQAALDAEPFADDEDPAWRIAQESQAAQGSETAAVHVEPSLT